MAVTCWLAGQRFGEALLFSSSVPNWRAPVALPPVAFMNRMSKALVTLAEATEVIALLITRLLLVLSAMLPMPRSIVLNALIPP